MKNETCEICRDLAPLVIDEVAGTGSKKYVSEHIQVCEHCRKYYNQLLESMPQNDKTERMTELAVLNDLRASQLKQLFGAAITGFATAAILGLILKYANL